MFFLAMLFWLAALGIFIWSLFSPEIAGYSYIAAMLLLEIWHYLVELISRPNPDPEYWDDEEIEIIRKYHIFIRYPFGARVISTAINGFRTIGLFLFSPWMLYNKIWICAAIAIVNYILVGPLIVRFDPLTILSDAVQRGKLEFEEELELLEDVIVDINERKY